MDRFTERIKQYPAKEQAELRVRVMLPGNMFPGLTPSEMRAKYEAEAFGFEETYHFPKRGQQRAQTCAGIRFVCVSDAMDDPDHPGFIIPLFDWNRHRHETYKDNRDAELPYITDKTDEGSPTGHTVSPSSGKAAQEEKDTRPPIYDEFELVTSGVHTVNRKDGSKHAAQCEFWRCRNTSGNCKNQTPYKVVKRSTGKMFAHLKLCNPSAYAQIKLATDGDENGDGGQRLHFKELLPHHVRYVLMTIMEWDHLWKCRSKARKEYVSGLKCGVGLPHRCTCIKIMTVIHALMMQKLKHILEKQKMGLGDPIIGCQDDIWSKKNCRQSFGALRFSLIVESNGKLFDINPLVAFKVFSSSSHSGRVIAEWKQERLKEWGLDTKKSVSLWTEDGASNNIKSSKILGVPYVICANHQLQRANLYALGLGGQTVKNEQLKAFIGRLSKQSSSFNTSGVASQALQDSQVCAH